MEGVTYDWPWPDEVTGDSLATDQVHYGGGVNDLGKIEAAYAGFGNADARSAE